VQVAEVVKKLGDGFADEGLCRESLGMLGLEVLTDFAPEEALIPPFSVASR
jgi:hypothetical protein